jgi:hypothetical protein
MKLKANEISRKKPSSKAFAAQVLTNNSDF